MLRPTHAFVLAAALLFCSAPAPAQQQQWQDANGKVYPMLPDPAAQAAPQNGYPITQAAAAPVDDPGSYVLGSGDKIKVTVFGEDNLSGEFDVDGSGLVRLPMIGTMLVGGLTARGAEAAITQALAAGYIKNPRVTVTVANYRPFFILGEVNKPGEYPYQNNMNALNAIALAGGFTGKAVTSSIYIQHQGQTVGQDYPADQRTRIYPGDVVKVDDTVFWRVMSYALPLAAVRPY